MLPLSSQIRILTQERAISFRFRDVAGKDPGAADMQHQPLAPLVQVPQERLQLQGGHTRDCAIVACLKICPLRMKPLLAASCDVNAISARPHLWGSAREGGVAAA